MLEHILDAACAVDELDRILVVLGADAELVRRNVRFGRAETVVCGNWSDGVSASLRCGLSALEPSSRVIVLLGDDPTLTASVIRRFLRAPDGARATYRGRPGHPVVLGAAQLARIAELNGDVGARGLIVGGQLIECGDLASGADVDTPADLEELRRTRP